MDMRIKHGTVVLCSILLLSCGTPLKEIALESQSNRTDVFQEVREGVSVPKGFVELTITSSIKTHLEGFYLFEPKNSVHGEPGYPFLVNMDGQAVTWKVDGQEEDTPTYGPNVGTPPEGGRGIRYNLNKKILLRAGAHKVFFALPGEKIFLQFELVLKEGEPHVLEFRPVYQYRGIKQPRNFVHGVETCEIFLNGNEIKPLK